MSSQVRFPIALATVTEKDEALAGIHTPFNESDHLNQERKLRMEERRAERARIARELHDTVFQGFLSASLLLHSAIEQTPSDAPQIPSLSRALGVINRVIDEGRVALQGLRSPAVISCSLEESLCCLREELLLTGKPEFRIFVTGHPETLTPELDRQIYLIVREAVANAARHSKAQNIEIELEYDDGSLGVVVRDDGCGMDERMIQSGKRAHWGLLGMRERAESVGAKLRILSRPGAGTEIEIRVPVPAASLSC